MTLARFKFDGSVNYGKVLSWKKEWDSLKVGDVIEIDMGSKGCFDCLIMDMADTPYASLLDPSPYQRTFLLKSLRNEPIAF